MGFLSDEVEKFKKERRMPKSNFGNFFDTQNFQNNNFNRNKDLKQQLADFCDYEYAAIDKDTERKIVELKEISKSIENKIISNQTADNTDYKINYRKELNQEQFTAVTTVDAPLLVIAGAGSGKTRIITYKVSYLIEKGLKPSEILLLTFTRKAANEMLSRVEKLLGPDSVKGILGGTFHGFANSVLRRYANLLGLKSNFTIIDTEDSEDIIYFVRTELNLPSRKNGRAMPKKSKIYTIISRAKNLELSIADVIEKFFPEDLDFIEEIELISKEFIKYKTKSNLMDYDDLLEIFRNKLKENKDFRQLMQNNIKYILVDEYQDTNNIQREIIELLVGESDKITIVGDDSQSIYAFRGANFENILRFSQIFSNCKVVKIEENYRSNQGILDFTNDIIANAQIGFKKELRSTKYSGKKPLIKKFDSATQEAEFIVEKIIATNASFDFSNYAVLTRASWHSNYIQAELMRKNIPFVVVGGIKFSERRHIKDIIAFLRILTNSFDKIAWNRILKLSGGIGKVRAEEITNHIHANNGVINFEIYKGKKYYENLHKYEDLVNSLIGTSYSPNELVEILIKFYKPILKSLEDDFEIREKDLDTFLTISQNYIDLDSFLSDFTLEPPSNRFQDESTVTLETNRKPLVVSTIHSAKGLEWNSVFIPFALDGIMPSSKSFVSIHELEEERRLFYVAASRAKENLYVTMPNSVAAWDIVFDKPSRFLAELNQENYEVD